MPSTSEVTTATKIFEIKEPIQITGPGQMLTRLRNFLPDYAQPDLLYIWLDQDDNAVQISQTELIEVASEFKFLPQKTAKCEKLIAVFRAETKESAQQYANQINTSSLEPLDVLLIVGNSWWSHLCSNIECCPMEGRSLPKRNELDSQTFSKRHEVWLNWLNTFNLFNVRDSEINISPESQTELRKSLNDLAIRDCILNHLAINAEHQNAWERIFSQLLTSDKTFNNHVLYCLLAAIHFSQHDLGKADFYTRQSLLLEPEYSLSKLMEHGLEIKMDCNKIVAAFTHYSADELLRNTPVLEK